MRLSAASISKSPRRRIASVRCCAFGATSRNLRYAAIASPTSALMPLSSGSSTSRPDRVFSVGALSSCALRLLAQADSNASATRSRTARRRPGAAAAMAPMLPALASLRGEAAVLGRPGVGLLLARFIGLPCQRGAVIELSHREAGLRGVGGQAFLLARELGHGEFLHLALLLIGE